MRLKKHLPTREQLRNIRALKFLGERLHEPNLWHFNRHSLSFAFLIGGFCSFLPIPFQTIPCALLAIWLRCNIPVSIVIVWFSNPLTMGPMMYFAYKVGSMLMNQNEGIAPLDASIEWFYNQVAIIWQPLLLGSLVCGLTAGITGFIGVRLYYRWRVSRYKKRKRQARKKGDITPI